MFELKPTKSQQEYTSRFLHLLSQVDTELPDVVNSWFFFSKICGRVHLPQHARDARTSHRDGSAL